MKKLFIYLTAIILSTFSTFISAERSCQGTIDSIGLGRWNNSVYIYSKSLFGDTEGRTLCHLKKVKQGKDQEVDENFPVASPIMCKKWHRMLEKAVIEQIEVVMDYDQNPHDVPCHQRATWDDYIIPMQIRIVNPKVIAQ